MGKDLKNKPSSILVVCTRRIGDVLLSLPAIRNLRAAHPDAVIDLLLFVGTEEIPSRVSYIDRVISIAERPGFLEHVTLVSRIFRKYELSISLLPGDRPTLYAWFAAPRSVGCLTIDKKNSWKKALLTKWVLYDDIDTHTLIMNLKVIELLGIEKNVILDFEVSLQEAELSTTRVFPEKYSYVIFHVYARFMYKHWTVLGWRELAKSLHRSTGQQIVLVGGKESAERTYANNLMNDMPPNTLDLVGKFALTQLSKGLSGASLYVGTDTAVTHLAAMLGVPTLALFGPSNPKKWGPWPNTYNVLNSDSPWQLVGSQKKGNVSIIQGQKDCVPCMSEGCQRHINSSSDCLEELTSERVLAAALNMLV